MSRSNVDLFLTNLRFLNLNSLPDWPAVTAQTLSTKDANQNQKTRIRAVEWALYRLFEIWDADETRNKLQPFFPPFEPLQSVNLRAALFRCLNEVKKNGVLGKETVLRKTMLDECKGDKFFEVLAIFSTAVLRRTLVNPSKRHSESSIVRNLVTASNLSSSEQALLLPLAVAHRSALKRSLERKRAAKARYDEFSAALDAKIGDISRRTEQYTASLLKSAKPQDHKADNAAVKKQVKDNWRSDPRWLDIILRGDGIEAGDITFERSFAETWQQIQSGQPLQESTANPSLLHELEARVSLQQNRVRRWRAFHKKICDDNERQVTERSVNEDVTRRSTTEFVAHEQYHLGERKNPSMTRALSDDIIALGKPVYKDILESMARDMANASAPIPRKIATADEKPDIDSTLSKLPRHTRNKSSVDFSSTRDAKGSSRVGRTTQGPSEDKIPVHTSKVQQRQSAELSERVKHSTQSSNESATSGDTKEKPGRESHSPSPLDMQPPVTLDGPVHEAEANTLGSAADANEETLVDKIISSVSEASPSPIKKGYLSLTERTRMSMAASFGNETSPTTETTEDLPPVPCPDPEEPISQNRRLTLLERTRQSMSNVALVSERPKPTQRKSMSKKTRQSLYPVNQFETPRRDHGSVREEEQVQSGKSTPKELLFSEDAEYESVFKSRPKVAMSPVLSSAEEPVNEMAENSPFEAESSDIWVMSSPLVSRHARRTKRGSVAD